MKKKKRIYYIYGQFHWIVKWAPSPSVSQDDVAKVQPSQLEKVPTFSTIVISFSFLIFIIFSFLKDLIQTAGRGLIHISLLSITASLAKSSISLPVTVCERESYRDEKWIWQLASITTPPSLYPNLEHLILRLILLLSQPDNTSVTTYPRLQSPPLL